MTEITSTRRGNRFKDLTGQRFGRLTVIEEAGLDRRGQYRWRCRCDCGGEHVAGGCNLRTGNTASCGCLFREAVTHHGHARDSGWTLVYRSWCKMVDRCTNPNADNWSRYGGRGITVCDRWGSFENFLADMGERPDGMTIDRIDNDRGYFKGNCQWATPKMQANNRRDAA